MKAFSFLSSLALLSLSLPLGHAQQATPEPLAVDDSAAQPALSIDNIGKRAPIIKTNSLLKVNVASQSYSVHLPWQKEQPGARRGLGVVLNDHQVLVTAQMVADSTYIELELPETGQKMPARVKAVDYEANVALLVPDSPTKEEAFFADLQPMDLASNVRIGDGLSVWQIGAFGELIVTPLRISKVETSEYFVSGSVFLVYEGMGIVRSEGNSFTLPVVKDGKLAGLLLRYDSKNQVTTVLPASIIEHFLKDTADGEYQGFPSLGVEFQLVLDEQFREYLGMKPRDPGMYISKVVPGSSGDLAGLKEGDILTEINGFQVDSRGNYQDPQLGTLSISHIVRGRAYVGDPVKGTVLRDGAEVELEGTLVRMDPAEEIVSPYRFDRGPNYVLAGGLLFQELNQTYLEAFGEDRRSGAVLRLAHIADHPETYEEEGREKIVFLSAVLPTPSCQGYERMGGQIVNKVNGRLIKDLTDIDAAFKDPQDGIHTIEIEGFPHFIYVDAIAMEKDNLALMGGAFRVGDLKRIE